jgi:2-polyprenyl-3-methyl-5-hydroxy-6-metoxy-1,4-benzoquinol methylase
MINDTRVTCPVCEGGALQIVGKLRDGCSIMRCLQCRFEFVGPIWRESANSNELSTVTAPSYITSMKSEYEAVKRLVQNRAQRRLELYTRLLDGQAPTSILEVGSGTGWMVRAFSELGITCTGIELSDDLVGVARALGADVRQDDICQLRSADYSLYDVVFSSQTLEHITTPKLALSNIWRLLRPGGVLHIDVPNANSWGAKFRRLRSSDLVWGALSLPYHQMGYHAASLRRLFADVGLTRVRIMERSTDDEVFGQTILPSSFMSILAMQASRLLGHGYLLVGIARKPLN